MAHRTVTNRSRRGQQSVQLSLGLRHRVRVYAAYGDVEISALIEDALTSYLERVDRERAAKGLPPIPPPE
jgi:hypothetical protein